MDLRVLSYAVAVADHGSISAASREVLVAQPSLSRQIKKLEKELGAELFERAGKGVTLTPAGARFISAARDLLARAADAQRSLRANDDLSILGLVSAPQLHENIVGPAILNKGLFLRHIHVRDARDLTAFVIEGHADVGITPVQPPVGLESRVFTTLPMTLQIRPDDDPLPAGPIELADAPKGLICLEPHRETRRAIKRACDETGLSIDVRTEVETCDVAQLMAATGHGPCLVSDDQSKYGLTVHPLLTNGKPITMSVYAMWRHGHYAMTAIDRLLELLEPESLD